MCGRFTLRTSAKRIAEHFELFDVPDLPPRYNIAPTQDIAMVRATDDPTRRELVLARWGLVPYWSRIPDSGSPLINARCETVATTPAFRTAFHRRRCLIPADGFVEWEKNGRERQPFHIHRKDGDVFAFAGLWDYWKSRDADPILSCTIITTGANSVVQSLHDRMPVILSPADYAAWLNNRIEPTASLLTLLRPAADDGLAFNRISKRINNATNDDPDCLAVESVSSNLFD